MTNRSSTMTSGITGEGGQFADSERRKPVTECNLNVRVARVDRCRFRLGPLRSPRRVRGTCTSAWTRCSAIERCIRNAAVRGSVGSASITTAEEDCISVIGDALSGFGEDGNPPRLGEGIHDPAPGSPTGCHCRLGE
jgi:hypothetical protein